MTQGSGPLPLCMTAVSAGREHSEWKITGSCEFRFGGGGHYIGADESHDSPPAKEL